ncbi:MAG: hypothetical protein II682_03180 [Firmicutes bacterium]|nr:hypothetical protein [Bacillota bacterium]MBQ3964423.1 hypothetical protein [Bacillota bacterium]
MKTFKTVHTVIARDLNAHMTLYAGRAMEWAFEANYMATVEARNENLNIVYKDIHSFDFKAPAKLGYVLEYEVTVVRVSAKSMTMRTGVYEMVSRKLIAEGYMTFVTIDEATGKSVPCTVELDAPGSADEAFWREKAESYFK